MKKFKKEIWNFYHKNKREFSWRHTTNPYKILVSEIMLQQTQAGRVIAKYSAFVKKFPNWKKLDGASLHEVLKIWQGLGYNRRALQLKKIAGIVMEKYKGVLPQDVSKLDELPGIGEATASSIVAFAFNMPTVFIETNIRRVFIHFFFANKKKVKDGDILFSVEKTLDRKNPREWYYALMDYGAMLQKGKNNPNRRSAHYAAQSKFKGSNREVRGAILKHVTNLGEVEKKALEKLPFSLRKIEKNIANLVKEGFLKKGEKKISIN